MNSIHSLWEVKRRGTSDFSWTMDDGWVIPLYHVPPIFADCGHGGLLPQGRILPLACPPELREDCERRVLDNQRVFHSVEEYLSYRKRWQALLARRGHCPLLYPLDILPPLVWSAPKAPQDDVYWPLPYYVPFTIVPKRLADRFIESGITNVRFFEVILVLGLEPGDYGEYEVVEALRQIRRERGGTAPTLAEHRVMWVSMAQTGTSYPGTDLRRCPQCGLHFGPSDDSGDQARHDVYESKQLVPPWMFLHVDVFFGGMAGLIVTNKVKELLDQEKLKNLEISPVDVGTWALTDAAKKPRATRAAHQQRGG